ncbi:MAG: helix-turn-helix transcriptional regulator [Dysgonamonadaceae bacterium]|nr:helix-turn-helix transcriptional regulator [Dysgonamonadaceae bacterium]
MKHILKKENISQKEIALRSDILPQRINDLISGKRKFTPETSIKLEKALGINELGMFCKIQTNFEVYNYQNEQELKITPDLSKIHKALFWDVVFESINWIRDYKWIIQRTFEYGGKEEMREIMRFYGRDKVKSVLNSITETWWRKRREAKRKKMKV